MAAPSPVKGHVRAGHFITPYTGVRHHAIKLPQHPLTDHLRAAVPADLTPASTHGQAEAPSSSVPAKKGGSGQGGSGDEPPRRFRVTAERKGKEVRFTIEDAFFDWLQIKPNSIWADVDRLQIKHPDQFASSEDVQRHIQDVLAGAEIAMPATHTAYTLLVALRDHADHQAATVEFVLRGGKYRVRNAQKMPQAQLNVKLGKAGDQARLRRGKRNPTVPPRNPTTPGISAGSPVPPSDGPPTKPNLTLPPFAPPGKTHKAFPPHVHILFFQAT